jgi:glucose-1-phosphate thymidylyltransferase
MRVLEQRQGRKVCCPEETAYRMGFINAEQLARLANPLKKNGYGAYLADMLSREQNIGKVTG